MGQAMAVIGAVASLLLLIRLLIGPRRRHRLDHALFRAWHTGRRLALRCYHWRTRRRAAAQAAAVAQEAIDRARSRGVWKDNVFTPEAFRDSHKRH